MGKIFLRWAIAAIAGIIVAGILLTILQYAGPNLFPDDYGVSDYRIDSAEIEVPIAATVTLIIGWFVATFAGAWLAMRVANNNGPGWIVAGSVIGWAIYQMAKIPDEWWMVALAIFIPLTSAWLAQRATGMAQSATP